jgi:hypothetical protein
MTKLPEYVGAFRLPNVCNGWNADIVVPKAVRALSQVAPIARFVDCGITLDRSHPMNRSVMPIEIAIAA